MYAIGRIQFFLVLTTYLTTWQYVAEAGLPCVSDAECVAMSYTDISPYEGVSNDEGAKCGDGLWRFETHKSCQLSCSTDQFCIDKLGSCPAPQCTWDCVQGRCEMSNLATVAPCALGDCSSNSDCCATIFALFGIKVVGYSFGINTSLFLNYASLCSLDDKKLYRRNSYGD